MFPKTTEPANGYYEIKGKPKVTIIKTDNGYIVDINFPAPEVDVQDFINTYVRSFTDAMKENIDGDEWKSLIENKEKEIKEIPKSVNKQFVFTHINQVIECIQELKF